MPGPRRLRARLPLLVALLPAACAPRATPPPAAGAVDPVGHAADQLAVAVAARDALVDGRVEAAQEALYALVERVDAPGAVGVPIAAGPWLEALRADAAAGVSAVDAAAVGRAVAGLAEQCGACHADRGVRLPPLPPASPAPGGAVAAHMVRHQWAAEAMWGALVGPAPGTWEAAVQALREPPLDSLQLEVGPEQADALARLAQEVHEQADASLAAPETRTATYGRVLAACAACHGLWRAPG